jgi:hypothetical protein
MSDQDAKLTERVVIHQPNHIELFLQHTIAACAVLQLIV